MLIYVHTGCGVTAKHFRLRRTTQGSNPMIYFVYILRNENNQIYIGQTNNIDDRLRRHNSNYQKYTKNKGPWTLLYREEFATRAEAMLREKHLKGGKGREWIKSSLLV